jgi:bacterioferritin-associated ferredoxin
MPTSTLSRTCHCPSVSDAAFRAVVRDGAITSGLVHLRLGIGCPVCRPSVERRIREHSRPGGRFR